MSYEKSSEKRRAQAPKAPHKMCSRKEKSAHSLQRIVNSKGNNQCWAAGVLRPSPHPLLRRSAALAYTRRWWSILAMGAQSAAIDCILGQDPQVWAPQGSPPLGQILADADIGPEPSRVV